MAARELKNKHLLEIAKEYGGECFLFGPTEVNDCGPSGQVPYEASNEGDHVVLYQISTQFRVNKHGEAERKYFCNLREQDKENGDTSCTDVQRNENTGKLVAFSLCDAFAAQQ